MSDARVPRRLALALVAGAAAGAWRVAKGQAQGLGLVRESAVKAAFLYKFGSFVEYPAGTFASPDAPFVIGVFGDDAVAAELEEVARGRTVQDHRVAVSRVRGPDDASRLHVLYAGGSRESRIRELLASARGPVLTVTDAPLGGDVAPVLYFSEEQGRLRFVASLAAAAAHHLKLSSKLLAVARSVEAR